MIPGLRRLDGVLRLVYSRMGRFARIRRWTALRYRTSLIDTHNSLMHMQRTLPSDFRFHGRTVLEIGPGSTPLSAYYFLHFGAARVFLTDKFPRLQRLLLSPAEQAWMEQNAMPVRRLVSEGPARIHWEKADANPEPVDFIYANSVLEHMKNPGESLPRLCSRLRPGGLFWTYIDMRDHFDFKAPYRFLKYRPPTWERWLTREGYTYTNRLRVEDWFDLFKPCGLETIWKHETGIPGDLEGLKMDPCFQNRRPWVRELFFLGRRL